MKKVVMVILVAVLLSFVLTGCKSKSEKRIEELEQQIASYDVAIKQAQDEAKAAQDLIDIIDNQQKGNGSSTGQLTDGEYWCMGKNDTCQNKTKDAYDFYCASCDPDGDNVEG